MWMPRSHASAALICGGEEHLHWRHHVSDRHSLGMVQRSIVIGLRDLLLDVLLRSSKTAKAQLHQLALKHRTRALDVEADRILTARMQIAGDDAATIIGASAQHDNSTSFYGVHGRAGRNFTGRRCHRQRQLLAIGKWNRDCRILPLRVLARSLGQRAGRRTREDNKSEGEGTDSISHYQLSPSRESMDLSLSKHWPQPASTSAAISGSTPL